MSTSSSSTTNSAMHTTTTAEEHSGRRAGATEHSWCRVVPGGTGITVFALHLSPPIPTATIEQAIHKLQLRHPSLRARITHHTSTKKSHSFLSVAPSPSFVVQSFDATTTASILSNIQDGLPSEDDVFHSLVVHELNINPWKSSVDDVDVLFASVYAVESGSMVLVLRLHTAVVDRTSGGAMVSDLLELIGDGWDGGVGTQEEIAPAMESLVPARIAKKALLARGVGMIGYSLNFLRSSPLPFADVNSPRASRMVVLQLGVDDTHKLLTGCMERGIKLCGVLTAACLIAAVRTRNLPNKKYESHTITTLIDCRKRLTKVLSNHDIGFYQSAIQNLYTVNGEERLWDLSVKCHNKLSKARTNNKDLVDMADMNILMMKVITNPGMTPSSSMRSGLVSVHDEPQVYNSTELHRGVGVMDYIGCGSIHGLGTSIVIFDVIKDGQLVCNCVYPYPLHSREMIQEIIDEMKRIMVSGITG